MSQRVGLRYIAVAGGKKKVLHPAASSYDNLQGTIWMPEPHGYDSTQGKIWMPEPSGYDNRE